MLIKRLSLNMELMKTMLHNTDAMEQMKKMGGMEGVMSMLDRKSVV